MGQRVTEILPGRIITKRNSVKGLLPRREPQLVPIVEFALNLGNMMEKTAVAAFLAKFEVCARCNRWSDQEKTDQLMCALTGPASQFFWDMGAQENVTWKDLVLQLKARYGPDDQTSLYRIKLRTYRQGPGESLSNVVQ